MANSAFVQLANPISTAKSFLSGWRFPTNPWQFNLRDGSFTTVAGNGAYTCDQTIVQSEESSQIRFRRATSTLNAFQVGTIPAGTPGRMAMIQYIDRDTATGMILPELSARVAGITSAGNINFKMSVLWFTTDTPTIEPIIVWGDNPTFQAAFTEIKSVGDPIRILNPGEESFQFNKFDLSTVPENAHVAVVVYTTTDVPAGVTMTIADICMNRGPLGYASDPQTADEVLRECEFYYQQSYPIGTLPGTVTNDGSDYIEGLITTETGGADTWVFMLGTISTDYRIAMRATPIHNYYSPSLGTINLIDWQWYKYTALGVRSAAGLGNGTEALTNWDLGSADAQGIYHTTAAGGGIVNYGAFDSDVTPDETKSGFKHFQWVANSRLGV